MKLNKAISLAIECMKLDIKKIAIDANLYGQGIADYPLAKNRSNRKKQLEDAIELLSKLENK